MKPIEWFFDNPQAENGVQGFMSFCRYVVKGVFKVCFRTRVEGAEIIRDLPDGTASIVVGNHTSDADALFVWFGILPKLVRFMGKHEMFANGLASRYLAWAGVIPIDREGLDRHAIKSALRALKNGEIIGVFPEGTRVRKPGQVSEPATGMASLAIMAKVDIVPCGIQGADLIKPYGSKLIHFPRVTVRYGEPVSWRDFADLPKRIRAQAMTDEVMRRVNLLKVGEEPGPTPDLAELYGDEIADEASAEKGR